MSSHDDDRIAYLQGENADSLTAAERAELDQLRGQLKADATWIEPDPGLEDRIVAAVAEEGAKARAGAHARSTPRRRRRRGLAERFRLGPRALAFGGLAVAVVAIVVALSSAGGSRAPQFSAAISGTALAPSANGTATLTKTNSGWRIQLSASGLPRLANGRYYQAWLKSRSGILVPVGTFNEPHAVTLWAGVAPSAFPELTVTRQRANGNPASSGERVLVGAIHSTH
jgi:hypothetical protein